MRLLADDYLSAEFVSRVTQRALECDAALEYSQSREITEDSMCKFGIGYFDDSHYSAFYRRLLFPVRDFVGNVITYQGRALFPWQEEGAPKYWHGKYDKSNYIYGLYENYNKILEEDFVFVVEGPIDVISLSQVNIPAVALFSTAMSTEQCLLIRMFTKNVVMLLDKDVSGQKGSDKAAKILRGLDMNVVQVTSPGKDANEMYCDPAIGPQKLYNMCAEVTNAKFRTTLF